ncbi:ATP-binding protein [Streptomyces griseocarneus]|nr:ATP-binding protein [Streptomyces griseocarneus]
MVLLLPGAAYADGPVTSCSDVDICVVVTTPGHDGSPGKTGDDNGSNSHDSGKDEKCTLSDGSEVRCTPEFNRQDHCYYELAVQQPPHGPGIHDAYGNDTSGPGAYYVKDCVINDVGALIWLANPPNKPAPPDPAVLARQALSKMKLLGADIRTAPAQGKPGLIGMPVWMWTIKSDQTWGPQSATASAGGLSVTATAHVSGIAWGMGDGHTITCTSPGTAYDPSFGKRESPDCGYPGYTKVGGYSITATSTWAVTWAASDGRTGTLPDETRTAQAQARVGELQVVN